MHILYRLIAFCGCIRGNQKISLYSTVKDANSNCNKCTCDMQNGIATLVCSNEKCLINEDMVKYVNNGGLSWRASSNYPSFLGKTLLQGMTSRLGTDKPSEEVLGQYSVGSILEYPDNVDWSYLPENKSFPYIAPAGDQGDCSSSFAFSTAAVLSARIAKFHSGNFPLVSAQELLSCSQENDLDLKSKDCNGGDIMSAWDYINRHGVTFSEYGKEICYPYLSAETGKTGKCLENLQCSHNTRFISSPTIRLNRQNDIKREIIQFGPVQALMRVSPDLFMYKDGVYYRTTDYLPNVKDYHSVMIVGWGTENDIDYWLVQNSWGDSWGHCDDELEQCGFFKIKRGENECEIESFIIAANSVDPQVNESV